MSRLYKSEPLIYTGLSQAVGNQELLLPSNSAYYQATIIPSEGATGSVAISLKAYKDANIDSGFEPLKNPQTLTQEVINLANDDRSVGFSGLYYSLQVEPTSVVGTYKVVIQGVESL